MKVDIESGKYVLAVSGGVDSMVLLDILCSKPGIELVVAHFNHGIRSDSHLDEKLVKNTAQKHALPLEIGHGRLGLDASEAVAREARYNFLESVRKKYKAKAIITAHHQDDLIETALLNILRGTKRRGLSSLASSTRLLRPLLGVKKAEILRCARQNNLQWREDSSNTDTKYLRNYLRKKITPKINRAEREKLISNLEKVANTNSKIDEQIAIISQIIIVDSKLNRQKFALLPTDIGKELLVYWLNLQGVSQLPKQMVADLSTFIKTGTHGSRKDIKKGHGVLLRADFATWS